MIKEEILYKKSTTGTTVFYFVPNVTPEQVSFLQEPAYLIFNNLNVPVAFYNFASGSTELWKLENVGDYNINVLLNSLTTNYITGYSVSETFKKVLSDNEKLLVQTRFSDNVSSIINSTSSTTIHPTYVFFKEHEVDDMFANIKLSRSYETLDTLSIYNKPINSIPLQEAKTGILFGKLEAIQTLKDEVGNNIRIPLKNVPIGIFNASDEFPSPVSLDDNGDRFFMNLKETAKPNEYFDSIAFNEDQKFLKTASQFVTVPGKFKYVTITNDNGEFVIYDVPVGSQTVVFEVDLFKQGLTKDEIILNNFPFPSSDESNIGEFPSYYYNQVPVDVVPAWGTSQTGYTELDISVNLDLRKWVTYIFPPAAYGNEKLEVTVAKNTNNTFKVQVKDMTNVNFAPKVLEITEIPNDLDRRDGAKYLWFNEILGQRQQLEYFKFGCHVLKLPANLYDPNGFRTDNSGVPTNQKGLWLAAYQLKCFIDKTICTRATGGYKDPNSEKFWSHFDINFFSGATDPSVSGLGIFPYERPWTINYPEPYKIPPKPVEERFQFGFQRTFIGPYILEEPAYKDGDLVGLQIGEIGGFGLQETNGTFFPNQIAYVATKDFMYKYEKDVRYNETYANGFEPFWNQSDTGPYVAPYTQLAGMSSVKNGEKYQRVECGYGYFMKYIDWPRVFRVDYAADIYLSQDDNSISSSNPTPPGTFGNFKSLRSWRHNIFNIDNQNFAFAFNTLVDNKTDNNTIDIYRIVESGLDDIIIPVNFSIPTFMVFHCAQASRCEAFNSFPAWKLISQGQFKVKMQLSFGSGAVYYNDGNSGSSDILYTNGTPVDIYPGGYFYSNSPTAISYVNLNLPGNSNYDTSINQYTLANYRFEAALSNGDGDSRWYFGTNFSFPATTNNFTTGFVSSIGTGSDHGIVHNGLSDDFNYGGQTYHWNQGSGQDEQEAFSIQVTTSNYENQYQGGYLS